MPAGIRITKSPVVEVGRGEWQSGFDQMGQFLGFIISDLYTKAEYEKWRNKMLTASERKKIGDTVWWKDEETGMWYPQIDLPADVPIGLRLRFLHQIKTAGRSDLTQLEKEEGLRQRYRELTKELMEEIIARGQDAGSAPFIRDTVLPTLLLANQAPNIEDKISIMESLLQGLKRFTTSSKITLQDKERGLRIETRTQPVRKTSKTSENRETSKTSEKKKEEPIAGVILPPKIGGGVGTAKREEKVKKQEDEAIGGIILPPELWIGTTYPGGQVFPMFSTFPRK
jgi:hypothetical protein